jgi:adenine C2-methylase RlmN of 23S rRNA A2503 and tRNA A37
MPNAQDPSFALRELVDWQTVTGGMPVVIHFAPVPGQTDTPESVAKLVKMVRESGLRVSYNLVNFNPPPTWTNQLYTLGQKSLETIRGYILDVEPNAQVNIKERVGRDVYASCGMFVSK